jgi:glycosyltransferase involved in cell wall biosynthesis
MTRSLSWGLIVATYQRELILPQCLQLVVQQTRQPLEIIVIDASDNWESTRSKVMAEIAATAPHIRWVYAPARQRGLPLQRNQGMELATADILFFLDDDSLMHSTCAEEIMRIYEADTELAVAGVQASLTDEMPSDVVVEDEKKKVGWSGNGWLPVVSALHQFVWRNIFLMDSTNLCVPYYGTFPKHEIPVPIQAMKVFPVNVSHGCRMTFRREAIVREKFEALLMYYALNEDMDASYRVSRYGVLLEAMNAHLHHFHSNSGRLSRYIVTALSALNQAVCVRRYSDDLRRDRLKFYWLTFRRGIAEILKDGLSRRWTFPQARGILISFKYAPLVFKMSDQQLAEWYPRFQQEFVQSGRPPARNHHSVGIAQV